ncbi:hypothetical protein EJB05_03970 [Eragrostis curvula]|uniref:Uncharacterized protein n=1 Tax=Eragrostis curvula TaxID=38414 RepID=A0A5J9W9E6_9POAL|nr:hypothetical protein EJB05_42809 [Eragrostis curvula]TVU44525.1 hypothetical protein EJB05_03970 [Eragrostis curvula]
MKALPKTSNQSQRRREGNDATVAASVPTNDADASGKVADSSMQSGFVLASVACREQIVEEDASQYPSEPDVLAGGCMKNFTEASTGKNPQDLVQKLAGH